MVMQVLDMKKKPTTDGRRSRYEPLSSKEFRDAAKQLETLLGHIHAAAQEIDELKLSGVQIDGRNMMADAIADLKLVTRRAKTALYEVRLGRE